MTKTPRTTSIIIIQVQTPTETLTAKRAYKDPTIAMADHEKLVNYSDANATKEK